MKSANVMTSSVAWKNEKRGKDEIVALAGNFFLMFHIGEKQ